MLIVCEPRFGGGGGGSSSSSSVVSGVTVASDRTDSSSESATIQFISRHLANKPDSVVGSSFRSGAGARGVAIGGGEVAMILSSSLFDLCSS